MSVDAILSYHERTKHHPGRYARSRGFLDWDTQPDPWRTHEGASRVELPFPQPWARPDLDGDRPPPAPLSLGSLSQLFERGLGITAWKAHRDNRWALRANPSSGNLHPTEGWAWLPALEGLTGPGLYHYVAKDHALERRCAADLALPPGAVVLGLSSIPWREAWKYGERAWRYCNHDVGHALGALAYAAATLGWRLRWLPEPSDDDVAALLGLDRDDHAAVEAEHPALLALLSTSGEVPAWPLEPALAAARAGEWLGRPSQLSPETVAWPAIDGAIVAGLKPRGSPPPQLLSALPAPPAAPWRADAVETILRRRSAVDFDGETGLSRASFFALLERLFPREDRPPLDALGPWRPRVHPALFVHRVEGLGPGLYLLLRDPTAEPRLRAALRKEMTWEQVDGAPEGLRLLLRGDFRDAAKLVSCQQEIARDGAFALGFLGELRGTLEELGPWSWRALHWEAGVVGQAIYLLCEAAGIRATGIGCFFDDVMHSLLGLEGDAWHTVYHFAAGGPVEDARIQTEPAYPRKMGG